MSMASHVAVADLGAAKLVPASVRACFQSIFLITVPTRDL